MRTGAFAVSFGVLVLSCGFAVAQEQKSFRLEIGSNSVELDPGESVEITLPDGSKAQATLTANAFRTYRDDAFSFVYPSQTTVTKSDLGRGIVQHMMATAVGTLVIVQRYERLDPGSLVEFMLSQLTRESVAAGAKVEKSEHSRIAGQTLTGIKAREIGVDTVDFEILAYGSGHSGVIVITRIDVENRQSDSHLLDKFWETLKVN